MRLRLLVAVLCAVLLAGCGGSPDPTPSSTPARSLPSATLKPLRAQDKAVDLTSLRGPMVISLWASWCQPCKDELPRYQAFHQRYPKLRMLGVDWVDHNQPSARALLESAGTTYPNVVDPEKKFPGQALPQVILLAPDGTIAFSGFLEIKSVAQLRDLVVKHLGQGALEGQA